MPKAKSEKRNARLVKRGDVVVTDAGAEEVVRSVSVVLHLANGSDMPIESTADVEVVTEPQIAPEIQAALDAQSK